MERGLLPETCLAHGHGEQERVGEGCQIHCALVREGVSTWLQECVARIDEALNLITSGEGLQVRFFRPCLLTFGQLSYSAKSILLQHS
jgi:hypothetical protein